MRNARLLSYVALAFIFCGCAATQAPREDQPANDVTGVWDGTTRVLACETTGSGRCEALNKVRFWLDQRASRITGRYECRYGNFECRHGGADSDGYVQWGDIHGSEVRLDVLLPSDLSSCLFNGKVSAASISGTYQCYEGGAIIEQGMWQMARST
jgi:hypothetical protein